MKTVVDIMEKILRCNYEELMIAIDMNNLENYSYKAYKTKELGLSDGNYDNRLRLVTTLLLTPKADDRSEKLVRWLMHEELKDRETNDFQGIGENLEILTFLLKVYHNPEDQDLFKRAKEANFDCACGYNVNYVFPREIKGYDAFECVDLALELGDREAAEELLDLWAAEQLEWDKAKLRRLMYKYKRLGLGIRQLDILNKLTELEDKNENNREYCMALHSYLEKLIELEEYEKAWEVLKQLRESMEPEYYMYGFGRFVLERAMELINCQPENNGVKEIWTWASTLILNMKDLHLNLYTKSIEAAERIGDDSSHDALLRIYNEEKRRLQLFFND